MCTVANLLLVVEGLVFAFSSQDVKTRIKCDANRDRNNISRAGLDLRKLAG